MNVVVGKKFAIANKSYSCDAFLILQKEIQTNGPLDLTQQEQYHYNHVRDNARRIMPGDEYVRIAVDSGGKVMYRMHAALYKICRAFDLLPFIEIPMAR